MWNPFKQRHEEPLLESQTIMYTMAWPYNILDLCDRIIGKHVHPILVNKKQCYVLRTLAAYVEGYIKSWIAILGDEKEPDLMSGVGWEMFQVLHRGLQIIYLCGQRKFPAIVFLILDCKGQVSEIIDDARLYSHMISRLIVSVVKSLPDVEKQVYVEKMMRETDSDCEKLQSCLQWAWEQDRETMKESWPLKFPISNLIDFPQPNIRSIDIHTNDILGEGSYGVVYSALWHNIPVVVKHLNRDDARQNLSTPHPHIVQTLGYTQEIKRRIVLERMDRTLDTQMQRAWDSRPPLSQSIDLMLQIAKAMKFLHSVDVIHRNLKPSHVLLKDREDGSLLVKVSKCINITKANFKTATNTCMRGTMMYMAPEMRWDWEGTYSRKVDVYSFGLICAEILTGKKRRSMEEKLTLPNDIPRTLGSLIQSCIQLNDKERPTFEYICDSLWLIKEEILTEVIERQEIGIEIQGVNIAYSDPIVSQDETMESSQQGSHPAMESSQPESTWDSIVVNLCGSIKKEVDNVSGCTGEMKVIEEQCFVLRLLANCISQYVESWITTFGEGRMSNSTAKVGEKLIIVLNRGLRLINLCGTKDVSVIIGCKGQLSEILDDARSYVEMINYLLESPDVARLKSQIHSDWENLKSSLQQSSEKDKSMLMHSKSQSGFFVSSMLQMLETGLRKPNIDDRDLSLPEKELGSGAYGKVYSAMWRQELRVAVKEFKYKEDLQAELNIFKQVLLHSDDCPHIVQMLGYTKEAKLVLELMDEDLKTQIEKLPFHLIQSIELMLQIAKGMKFLHGIKVVHRDLKPANVLVKVREHGSPLIKITDFGISKENFHTSKHTIMRGTKLYMAPEMFEDYEEDMTPEGQSEEDSREYSKKVDVYSFGLICGEILTRKTRKKRREQLDLPRGIPKKLENLIKVSCVARDPKERPNFEEIYAILCDVEKEILMKEAIF